MEQSVKSSDFIHKKWGTILKNKRLDIVVTPEQMLKLLERIGNGVDSSGFIIDSKSGNRIKSNDNEDLRIDELGAFIPVSKNFIRNNIASFSHFLVEHMR